MTLKLFAAELDNFKSYVGHHSFEFPQEAGLYYLTGKNQFNSRLGANAAGKSSFIDSIEWCLYGKTHRGLRAGDVVSWGKKSCSASTSWLIGDDEYTITRTQSPNSLTINGEPATQEEVTKLFRINQEAFNCSVILPQFGDSFFDLTPAKKLEMFSQVMNLDYWLEKSKAAGKKVDVLAHKIEQLNNQVASRKGKLENNRTHVKSLLVSEGNFDTEIAAEVKAKSDRIKKVEAEAEGFRAQLKKLGKGTKGGDRELAIVKKAILEAGADFEDSEAKYSDYLTEVRVNERNIKDLKTALINAEKLKGKICQCCKQRIDEKHIEKGQSKAAAQVKELEATNKKLQKKLNSLEEKRTAARKDVNDLRRMHEEIRDKQQAHLSNVRSCERDIQVCEDQIKDLQNQIKKLKAKENPFTPLIATARKYSFTLKREMADLRAQLDELKVEHEAYSYWVGGFKRVRLFVIEEALASLEVEVNNLLISLGLVDWKITLDIERENKSGGVTKGFSVFIHSPKHDKPVKFEAWSGGEVQRLRLAGDLGLANLIMEQAGFINHIEIIDEPSTHMSREGIEDMIETIHQRAHDTGKQIWLVDHNTTSFTGFSGVLTAVMDAKGKASLEYK